MGIPAIQPYRLPDPERLPANRVDWRPDPERAVLLVHDMQHYFLDRFTPDASPVPEMLANIAALRDRCHALGVPVVYTAQTGGQDPAERGLLTEFWGPGLPGGDPRAAAIVDAVAPGEGDTVLTKWRYSGFVRTGLATVLHGRDQLVITGIYAHIGVQATAVDAFMRDIRPIVVGDAVGDFSEADHTAALTYIANRCGTVTSTAAVLAALSVPVLVQAAR